MTTKLELYYSPHACSFAVHSLIRELDLDCKYVVVDLKTKKTNDGRDFLTVNPKGMVPTLITENKEILTENVAILQYLADRYKATQFLPAIPDFKRYRVLESLAYLASDWHKGFSALFAEKVPNDLKKSFFIPNLRKRLQGLSDDLAKHPYLTGNECTVADFYFLATLPWLELAAVDLDKEYKPVAEFQKRMMQRKAVKEALETEENS